MRRVGGCCGTDWYRISGDQPVFFEFSSWSSGFCCLWTFGVVSRVVIFSSSSFEGVGFLLTTGPWFWQLLLEFVLFWWFSFRCFPRYPRFFRMSQVGPMSHVLDWLYLLRMRCAVSVLGFYAPAVHFGSCHIVASSLGVWPSWLKYDWTLIQRVIGHPVTGLPDYRCFVMARGSHLRGFFIPLQCDAFRHRSLLLSWCDLLDPVFASFALVKVVPVNLCPLLLFDMCDYLVITGGLISRCRVLTFTPL